MGKRLLNSFAEEDPEHLAGMLERSGDIDETLAIVTEIDTALVSNVVARLSPDMSHRLLQKIPDTAVIEWLDTGSDDAGRRLLSKIDPARAARLIEGIGDRSRRRALRRLSSYSAGTIGQLTQVPVMVIGEKTPASDISTALQRGQANAGEPVAIERQDGKVLGVLDFAKFARNTSDRATAADFCLPVEPVLADAPLPSLSSLARSEGWAKQTSLPVVDHRHRLIGYVTRAALEEASASEREEGLFLASTIELVRQYWAFMVYMTTLILGRRLKQ